MHIYYTIISPKNQGKGEILIDITDHEVTFRDFVPLETSAHMEFPVGCLPLPLREMCMAVAENTTTNVAMAASVGLGILSAVAQGRVLVEGYKDYQEQTSLYIAVIGESGVGKTPVYKAMHRPIKDIQQALDQAAAEANKATEPQRKKIEREIKVLTRALNREYSDELNEQISKCEAALDEYRYVVAHRMYTSDCTSERLEELLQENGGVISVMSSEGGQLDNIAGRYSANHIPNLEVWLKGYGGEDITTDRIGRATVKVPAAHVSVLIMTQPESWQKAMANPNFTGRGLTERFLFCEPPEVQGGADDDDNWQPPEMMDPGVVARYAERIKDIYHIPGLRIMRLTPHALQVFGRIDCDTKRQLREMSGWLRSWTAKYRGTVLRIAGLLALCADPTSCTISEDIMVCAQRIAEYYKSEAAAAARRGAEQKYYDAKALAKIIVKHAEIKRSALYASCRGKFETTSDMDPVLELLVEHGYIALKSPPRQEGAGRPPADIIVVNPIFRGLAE